MQMLWFLRVADHSNAHAERFCDASVQLGARLLRETRLKSELETPNRTLCAAAARRHRRASTPMADTMDIPREEVLLGRCCECGIGFDPRTHPTMTCVNCLQARADIAEGVCPNGQLFRCRRCLRYCGGATTYVACEPESRELMAICLKRVRGSKESESPTRPGSGRNPTPCD